ncbi:MAG: DUF2520 domain-containing protein [Bacteroidetes bacterium]|nr:DUF2520 domain-containing protein [Bacteroidota bacterium]HET6245044.1 DUF2520 domain-containing protein [Bacteroidia bacterium]
MSKKASANFPEIVLIGAGNLATHLGKCLYGKGFKIAQVYSKTQNSANILAKALKAEPITSFTSIKKDSDYYFICLKDDVINESVSKIPVVKGIVIHTSGSVSMGLLSEKFEHCGVLYPIQTFNKKIKKISFKHIPLCTEASNEYSLNSILQLANTLSDDVRLINSKQRQVIHLAAVFACNFSNHLFAIAADLLKKEEIDFSILYPLIVQTIEKVKSNTPLEVQTGPAVRSDLKTIEKHMELLQNEINYQEIYRVITGNILNSHQK